jgi:hypothetical protein
MECPPGTTLTAGTTLTTIWFRGISPRSLICISTLPGTVATGTIPWPGFQVIRGCPDKIFTLKNFTGNPRGKRGSPMATFVPKDINKALTVIFKPRKPAIRSKTAMVKTSLFLLRIYRLPDNFASPPFQIRHKILNNNVHF